MFKSLFDNNSEIYVATYEKKAKGKCVQYSSFVKSATPSGGSVIIDGISYNTGMEYAFTDTNSNTNTKYVFTKISSNFIMFDETVIYNVTFHFVRMPNFCLFITNNNYDKLYYSLNCGNVQDILQNYPDMNNCLILKRDAEYSHSIYLDYIRSLNHCFLPNEPHTIKKLISIITEIANQINVKYPGTILYCSLIDKAKFSNGFMASYIRLLQHKPGLSIYNSYDFKYKSDILNSQEFKDIYDDDTYINKINFSTIITDLEELNSIIDDNAIMQSSKVIFAKHLQNSIEEVTYDYDVDTIRTIKSTRLLINELINSYNNVPENHINIGNKSFAEIYDSMEKSHDDLLSYSYKSLFDNLFELLNSNVFYVIRNGQKYGYSLYILYVCMYKINIANAYGLIKKL